MIKKIVMLMLVICSITGCLQPVDCTLTGCYRTGAPPSAPEGWPSELPAVEKPPLGQMDCSDKGTDASNFLSKMLYYVFDPIKTQVTIVSRVIFENFIIHPAYRNIIRILLVLYIVIYGIMFVSNLVQATATDLLKRLVTIGIILILTTGGAYNFFNTYLFKLFTTGSEQLIRAVVDPEGCSSETNFFAPVGYVISVLTSKDIMLRLTAMMFAFPIGWLCFPLFVLCILRYAFAILKIIISYLICFTAVAFLIALAPMFIILLLFEYTRAFFNQWLKLIITFALQPVLMFTGIYIVSAFVNQILFSILGKCIWVKFFPIDLSIISMSLPVFDVCWYLPEWWVKINPSNEVANVYGSYLTYLGSLIMFYMCTDLLGKIPEFVETLATFLSDGKGTAGDATSMASGGISGAATKGKELLFGKKKKNEDHRGLLERGVEKLLGHTKKQDKEEDKGLIGKGAEKLKGLVGMDKDSKDRREAQKKPD